MSAKPKTPGLVIFVGVLLIIFGGLSILGGPCTAGVLVMAANAKPPMDANGKEIVRPEDAQAVQRFIMREVPSYLPVTMVVVGIDLLLGIGQLIAAIGVIRLHAMSRVLAILITVFKMVLTLANLTYSAIFVFPAQGRFYEQHPIINQGQAPIDVGLIAQVSTYAGVGCMLIFQIAIVLTIILVLNARSVKDAFEGKIPEDQSRDEDDRRSRYEGYEDDDDFSPRSRRPSSSSDDTGITER